MDKLKALFKRSKKETATTKPETNGTSTAAPAAPSSTDPAGVPAGAAATSDAPTGDNPADPTAAPK